VAPQPPQPFVSQPFDATQQQPTSAIGTGVTAADAGTPPARKKKIGLIVSLIVAGVLVLLGAGAAAAYTFWYQNPDKVVGDALVNALTADSITGTGAATITANDMSFKITMDGKAKQNFGTTNAKVEYTADGKTVVFEGAATTTQEGDIYLKVKNVRPLTDTYFSMFGGGTTPKAFDAVIQKIEDNWIKISKDDLGTVSEEAKKTQACFDETAKSLAENKSWAKQLATLYQNNKFILITKELGTKTVAGTNSMGYELDFDTNVAANFAKGLSDTDFGKKVKECDASINYDDFAQSLEKAKKGDATTNFQVWVSQFGHDFTQVTATASTDDTKADVTLEPKFNQPVTVAAPEKSISAKDLQAEIEAAFNAYVAEQFAVQ
jgi:flagellar basal body-associated protein FliL